MSTNPWGGTAWTVACALTASVALAACAGPAPEPGHEFGEVRLHRVAAPPAPAYLRAAAPFTPSSAADASAAAGRVRALLAEDDFTVEDSQEGAAWRLTATRMARPQALRDEAACALKAMRRPDFSASDLDVRVGPRGAVTVSSRFVLVDTNLISGELTRQTCRSNGALEAAVRRAAAG